MTHDNWLQKILHMCSFIIKYIRLYSHTRFLILGTLTICFSTSAFLLSLLLFRWNTSIYVYEHAGTAVGRMLITLSNNPAPTAASSPRGSAPLLMETNSAGSAWGRGVSKHPPSSHEKHVPERYWNPLFDCLQKGAGIYVYASAYCINLSPLLLTQTNSTKNYCSE